MASQTTQLLFLCFTLFSLLNSSTCTITQQNNDPKTRGIFVFGASVVDNGNNNYLTNSLAQVNYLPYGIDFPFGPTGRFTNGETIVDLLGKKLGLRDFIPPFNDPSTTGARILHGVNYASGASGILNDTGFAFVGNVTSLSQQISEFERVTLPELQRQLGSRTRQALSEYLFVVASGSNDYSINYFMSNPNNVTLEDFTANLIATYENQLKRLYRLGARKFVLFGINPTGCGPSARSSRGCNQALNQASVLFNGRLRNLVDTIRPQIPGSNSVFVDAYKIITDILQFPLLRGFRNTTSACCDISGNGLLCRRGGRTCPNRDEYVYFDGTHTTEDVNTVIANKAYASPLRSEVSPFNVLSLSLM